LLAESYGALYKKLFPKLKSKRALAFFQAFPVLDDALADLPRVRALLGEEKASLLEEAGGWGEGLYLETLRLEVRLTIQLCLAYRTAIKELETKMVELSHADPEVKRLKILPGIGTTLALTILWHSGHFSRFRSQDAYAAYCGLAPTLWQSGQSRTYAQRRRRYSRPLRQAFLHLALTQLRLNPESQAYYERKRREGKPHWVALIALARQLCKRVYKMMGEGTAYTHSSLPLDIDG
jgi:transposase